MTHIGLDWHSTHSRVSVFRKVTEMQNIDLRVCFVLHLCLTVVTEYCYYCKLNQVSRLIQELVQLALVFLIHTTFVTLCSCIQSHLK